MPTALKFKPVLATAFALILFSCNNAKKDKVKVTEVTLQDIKQEKDKSPEPPPPPPPKMEMVNCFSNNGLKYSTTVTITIADKKVTGTVTSEDLGHGDQHKVEFEGRSEGDNFYIKFKGTPPAVGDASEWTDKPWSIKKEGGKETLHIIFNAKNYETNKWEDTDYQFAQVECKN